jgi:hypothetical protein
MRKLLSWPASMFVEPAAPAPVEPPVKTKAQKEAERQAMLRQRSATRRTINTLKQLDAQASPTRPLTDRERQIVADNLQARDRQMAKSRLFGKGNKGVSFGGNRANRRRLLGVLLADNKQRVKRKVGLLRAQD